MNNTKLYTDMLFPAKLILFGEYTVLFGGDALAVPYTKYSCNWASGRAFMHPELGKHIAEVVENYPFLHFDISYWTTFTQSHFIDSTIPLGYGLGSSGSVIATIFHHFFSINDFDGDLFLLKTFLGELESFFHGKSSGIDPLVSLLNVPLKINKDAIELVELDKAYELKFKLYDSGIARNNKNAISKINLRYSNDPIYRGKMDQLLLMNNEVIEAFVKGEFLIAMQILKGISLLQLELFDELIPPSIRTIWEGSLAENRSIYKLCGGGGGGYFLQFHQR